MLSVPRYKVEAAAAQQRRASAIPEDFIFKAKDGDHLPNNRTSLVTTSGHFSTEEATIVTSDVEVILANVKNASWTSVAVTAAFCKSAAFAQQMTNCLTEVLFEEAFTRARELDDFQKRTGTTIGPLHGLPISLKDSFVTPPHPSSIGLAGLANASTHGQKPSVLVSILQDLGAILFAKTNVPTAMMMMETNNNVWGPVVNPLHAGCNAGGSSGGEAALIAMYGSPIGIGTDIGGSIRIPSAFCGLFGLKPSYGRFPQWGGQSGIPGQEFVLAVNGPIARSVSALQIYSSAVLSNNPASSPWTKDPKAIPLPWQPGPHIFPPGRPLRIAFAPPTDGLCTAHPPIARGLSQTRAALEAAGHETIDWSVDDHADIVKLLLTAFFDFGGKPIIEMMAKYQEPLFPSMNGYAKAAEADEGTCGPTQLREMNVARNALQKAYLDRWQATADPQREKQAVDAIIMPTSPWTAVRAGFTNEGDGHQYFGFTGVFNLLDLPSCTFPATKADRHVDLPDSDYKALNSLDEIVQADYDADFYHGTPVTLQCVGERLAEEKLLEIVSEIMRVLN